MERGRHDFTPRPENEWRVERRYGRTYGPEGATLGRPRRLDVALLNGWAYFNATSASWIYGSRSSDGWCTLRFLFNGTSATGTTAFYVPEWMRPPFAIRHPTASNQYTTQSGQCDINPSGAVAIQGTPSYVEANFLYNVHYPDS